MSNRRLKYTNGVSKLHRLCSCRRYGMSKRVGYRYSDRAIMTLGGAYNPSTGMMHSPVGCKKAPPPPAPARTAPTRKVRKKAAP